MSSWTPLRLERLKVDFVALALQRAFAIPRLPNGHHTLATTSR